MEVPTALQGPCLARAGIMCGAIDWGGATGLGDVGDVGVDDPGLLWDELASLYTQIRPFW